MSKISSESFFTGSLDTFKAFDNLTVENSGVNQAEFPATVWQILNHLIVWQQSQLNLIRGFLVEKDFSEKDTWVKGPIPQNESILQEAVEKFRNQLLAIEAEILTLSTQNNLAKLKVIQELSLHLAFHLGEVVLIRRLTGSYPLPHQMKEFLKS